MQSMVIKLTPLIVVYLKGIPISFTLPRPIWHAQLGIGPGFTTETHFQRLQSQYSIKKAEVCIKQTVCFYDKINKSIKDISLVQIRRRKETKESINFTVSSRLELINYPKNEHLPLPRDQEPTSQASIL